MNALEQNDIHQMNNGNSRAPETRQITDFSLIEMLYNTRLKKDFARDELKPLASMRRSWKKNAYDCYGLFDGEEILGYAFFVRRDRDYLFDYFAIAEERRNEGLGSVFLKQLADCVRDADCIVGEVEDPDMAEDEETSLLRERRMQFYLRSGYRKTELTSTVFGVDYRILELPTAAEHKTEELGSAYTELYRSTLPAFFFRTQFRVREKAPTEPMTENE